MHPSGNREKSPATCLFTLNDPGPEEVRDAPYTESENGQALAGISAIHQSGCLSTEGLAVDIGSETRR